ncbi:MAG: DNA-directed RNA polymerase subunit alpha [Patescibacteria group bacterium]|nr:DNA-directed RNA polymerase subunit alpha [Patescibacteria group bacterium]
MVEPIFQTKVELQSQDYAKIIFEPLHPSFGNSLGNSIRRTLLSSLKGAAIGYVRIEGAPHLFSTIPGVKESVLDIVLNLKQVRFSTAGDGPFVVRMSVKGARKVTASDLVGEAEVVNGDLYLAEITDEKAQLEIEAIVETGYGFVASEEKEEKKSGFITVDSAFSPVSRVNFKVEEARVGRKSNYERLIMEVWTDGSIAPKDAVATAVETIRGYLSHIFSGRDTETAFDSSAAHAAEVDANQSKHFDTIIDELNLPSRVINALLRENIETVGDLVKRGKENLVGLKGVGRKSIDLVEEELKKMNIKL